MGVVKHPLTPVLGSSREGRLKSPGLINRSMNSRGSSRGSNRPVSREDVKKMEIPTFEKLQRANSPVMGRVSGAATSPIAQLVIQEDIGERW